MILWCLFVLMANLWFIVQARPGLLELSGGVGFALESKDCAPSSGILMRCSCLLYGSDVDLCRLVNNYSCSNIFVLDFKTVFKCSRRDSIVFISLT